MPPCIGALQSPEATAACRPCPRIRFGIPGEGDTSSLFVDAKGLTLETDKARFVLNAEGLAVWEEANFQGMRLEGTGLVPLHGKDPLAKSPCPNCNAIPACDDSYCANCGKFLVNLDDEEDTPAKEPQDAPESG